MTLPFDLRTFVWFSPSDHLSSDGPSAHSPSENPQSSEARRPTRGITIPVSLVTRIQQHDVEAFRDFVRLVYVPLVRFACTIVSSDEAEDIVQDVLTLVWDHGEAWHPSGDVVAYLFASVRNRSLKELRRRHRERRRSERAYAEHTPQSSSHIPLQQTNTLDQVVESETYARRLAMVSAILATCTERQRTAYDLRYRRGLTIPAIATVLEISVKGTEQLVRRVTEAVTKGLSMHDE